MICRLDIVKAYAAMTMLIEDSTFMWWREWISGKKWRQWFVFYPQYSTLDVSYSPIAFFHTCTIVGKTSILGMEVLSMMVERTVREAFWTILRLVDWKVLF